MTNTECYYLPVNTHTFPPFVKFGKHACNDVTPGNVMSDSLRIRVESLHDPIQFAASVSAPQTAHVQSLLCIDTVVISGVNHMPHLYGWNRTPLS